MGQYSYKVWMSLVIISILSGTVKTKRGIRKVDHHALNVMDDSHFFPSAGVYMEPAGQFMSYAGSITVPFVYLLPKVFTKQSPSCPDTGEIQGAQRRALDHIKSLVTERMVHYPLRSKRSLFPILSVVSGGLSLWNTYEIHEVKDKIIRMNIGMERISDAVEKLTTSQNIIIDQVGQVSTMVGEHARLIERIINRTTCLEMSTKLNTAYLSGWLISAPTEFVQAYSSAVSGKVSPTLVNARNLKEVLTTHKEMDETIYQNEPELVYEFGKVILLQATIRDTAIMKGIIILPKILASSPMPMYDVYKVNTLQNDMSVIYNIPDILICSSLANCWSMDTSKCTRQANRMICIYGTNMKPNKCISSLYKNQSDGCSYSVKKQDQPILFQTRSGILVGGSNSTYQVFKRSGIMDTHGNTIHPNNKSRMITQEDGDWITVNNNIYSTMISGISYNFSIYIGAEIEIPDIPTVNIPRVWTNIEHLKYDAPIFDDIGGKDLLFLTLILGNCVLVIIVFIYFYRQNKVAVKNKYQDPDINTLVGLR